MLTSMRESRGRSSRDPTFCSHPPCDLVGSVKQLETPAVKIGHLQQFVGPGRHWGKHVEVENTICYRGNWGDLSTMLT